MPYLRHTRATEAANLVLAAGSLGTFAIDWQEMAANARAKGFKISDMEIADLYRKADPAIDAPPQAHNFIEGFAAVISATRRSQSTVPKSSADARHPHAMRELGRHAMDRQRVPRLLAAPKTAIGTRGEDGSRSDAVWTAPHGGSDPAGAWIRWRTIVDMLGHKTIGMARHYAQGADLKRKVRGVAKRLDKEYEKRKPTKVSNLTPESVKPCCSATKEE